MTNSKHKLKILYIDHSKNMGGAPISLLQLVDNLDQNKFDITISCNSQKLKEFYESYGIKTKVCNLVPFQHTTGGWWRFSPTGLRAMFRWLFAFGKCCSRLSKLILEIQPDLVHFNSVTLTPYAKTVNQACLPLIIHVREYVVGGYLGLRKRWMKYLLQRFASEIIFICKANKVVSGCKKGMVIYNPVEISKFNNINKEKAKEKLGLRGDCKVILYVSGLRSINGPMVFVRAMQQVAEEVPSVKFLMPLTCGSLSRHPLSILRRRIANMLNIYSIRQKIEGTIFKSALQEKVIRTSFVNNIEEYFAASDVVVVPFIEPHFARPVMEAGAASSPVVASNIEGITEVVNDGESGFLFTPGDSEELAEKIVACLQDNTRAKAMGQRGYQLAKERFDVKLHVEKISKIYSTLWNNVKN